jgi:hypothetical protein
MPPSGMRKRIRHRASVVWAILADSLKHEVAVFLGTAVANVAYHHRLAAPNRDPYARRMATVHFGKG